MATGTLSQTLSTITQALDGEASYSTLIGEATVSDFSFAIEYATLTDIAIGGDSTTAVERELVVGTAEATEVLTFSAGPLLHETAQGFSSMVVHWTTLLAPSGFRAQEFIEVIHREELTGTAEVSDALTAPQTAFLQTTAYASEVLTPSAVHTQLVSSTAVVSEVLTFSAGAELVDVATVAGDITFTVVQAAELLTSTAVGSSTTTWTTRFTELLIGTAEVSETLDTAGSTYSVTVHDTAVASSTLWARDFGALAWVMNTETGATWNYENFEFTSLAYHDGVLYGTAPDGVFAFTADDDAGRNIDATIQTGFEDFETSRKKRISDIYIGYTGGTLECDVEAYGVHTDVYTYTVESREAETPRNNRFKSGRGLSSRYWRLTLRNVDGADFQLHDLAVVAGTSDRRL